MSIQQGKVLLYQRMSLLTFASETQSTRAIVCWLLTGSYLLLFYMFYSFFGRGDNNVGNNKEHYVCVHTSTVHNKSYLFI